MVKYTIQTVTTHISSSSKPSVMISFESKKYLFNCGEGLQRFMHDRALKTTKLSAIFLTRLKTSTLGGLPGMIMTLADKGTSKLQFLGPAGLTHYISGQHSFLQRKSMTVSIKDISATNNSEREQVYSDENLTIYAVSLLSTKASQRKNVNFNTEEKLRRVQEMFGNDELFDSSQIYSLKRSHESYDDPSAKVESTNYQDNDVIHPEMFSICYVIRGMELPGKFNAAKAAELEIQPTSGCGWRFATNYDHGCPALLRATS